MGEEEGCVGEGGSVEDHWVGWVMTIMHVDEEIGLNETWKD